MELLDVQCSGGKDDKIDAVIEFLKKPEASGREFSKKIAGGSTKRKASTKKKSSKKKKAKTSEKTPRKLSAFMHFGMATRPKIKEENPDASFGELGKLLGVAWKEASDKVRAKFQKIADEAAPVEKKASKKKSTKKSTKKKPAKKKAKKQESSSEEESEEEASDSDAPLGKKAGMSAEMKDKIREIIDGADLEKLTRTQIKADLAKSFDDVEDHKDEIKEFVVSYVNSKK